MKTRNDQLVHPKWVRDPITPLFMHKITSLRASKVTDELLIELLKYGSKDDGVKEGELWW